MDLIEGHCGWSLVGEIRNMAEKKNGAPDYARPRGDCRVPGFGQEGNR